MADYTDSYTTKPQILNSQVKPNHPNPSKFYTHFLYKALIVTIFLVLLPLFPSQPPEFINQTLHTRSWEVLQLIFVGIAVSYGLFSKRNDETDKEHSSKFDNAQSYVSRLLQVSSVFDDESENPSLFDDNKVQTWSSQYHRGEPVIMVAQKTSVLEEQKSSNSPIGEKPLLLPVRSLKYHDSDSDVIESTNESSVKTGSLRKSSSNSGSRLFSNNLNKPMNGEFVGVSPLEIEKKVEENVVLRSPIPWRSRSGRMEFKEDEISPSIYSLPPSADDHEVHQLGSRSFRSQSSRSSNPNSTSPSSNKLSPSSSLSSPKNPSPSPSLSPEIQVQNTENFMRRKSFHKVSPPRVPSPPPLPPPFLPKSSLVKSNSSVKSDVFYSGKELKRSVHSLPLDLNLNGTEELLSRTNFRSELRPRTQNDCPLKVKSVRKTRSKEFGEDFMNKNEEKKSKELESNFTERRGYTDKSIHQRSPIVSNQTFSDFPKEEVVVETDDDSESEDEYFEGCPESEVASNVESDGGPDVDKKADEFIAKFREQIRLQRIESIRKSTSQPARKTV